MKCIVHTYSYTGPRLIKMAQRQQFRSVHSMYYNTKYGATADQTTDQFFVFILPWRILFCRGEFYFAVVNFILPRWIVFCREEFYFAVVNCILPWRILFCREEFYFAVKNSILPWQLWATVSMCPLSAIIKSIHCKFKKVVLTMGSPLSTIIRRVISTFIVVLAPTLNQNDTLMPKRSRIMTPNQCKTTLLRTLLSRVSSLHSQESFWNDSMGSKNDSIRV